MVSDASRPERRKEKDARLAPRLAGRHIYRSPHATTGNRGFPGRFTPQTGSLRIPFTSWIGVLCRSVPVRVSNGAMMRPFDATNIPRMGDVRLCSRGIGNFPGINFDWESHGSAGGLARVPSPNTSIASPHTRLPAAVAGDAARVALGRQRCRALVPCARRCESGERSLRCRTGYVWVRPARTVIGV